MKDSGIYEALRSRWILDPQSSILHEVPVL